MSVAQAEPAILHATPGRLRVHLPGWSGRGRLSLQTQLCQVPGIHSARANELTGNVVVGFDPATIRPEGVLEALRRLRPRLTEAAHESPPAALVEHRPEVSRARITVRGLDRNPRLARAAVDHLLHRPGVLRVSASALTGRVLVEFDRHQTELDDLIADVMGIELPEVPGEVRPSHPLDPGPLRQSLLRTVEVGVGLAFLAGGRATGRELSPGIRGRAGGISAVIGLLQGIPLVRYGVRRLLGRDLADLVFHIPGILSLTLAGSWLGLLVIGGESIRLLTEVLARREAWRRYEGLVANAPASEPGAVISLESGERTPRAAEVLEGVGTGVGRDGLPVPLRPGVIIEAGSRLYGGPFRLRVEAGESFTPSARPVPPAPTLFDRYVTWSGPVSLAYAALTGLFTRSLGQAFSALLLVNPRPAMIGLDAADTGAAARALRAGAVVVGSRFGRVMRRPNLVLVGEPRTLTNGFELSTAQPIASFWTAGEVAARAAEIAAAAGHPWGGAFGPAQSMAASDGTFDGATASAEIEGESFSLGPPTGIVPAAVRLRYRGEYLLVLRHGAGQELGYAGIRPRLANGVRELVDGCRRRGIPLGLLPAGDAVAARLIAERTGIQLLSDTDPVACIRSVQALGSLVAYVADSAGAAPAFAACDLAIGLSSGRTGRFAARADLLAPDLQAVTAILEATTRRETAVRDSVVLSAASNVAGAVWGLRTVPGLARATFPLYFAALAALGDGWIRLRGGVRATASILRLTDPRPERWGRRSIEQVLVALHTSPSGLTGEQAEERREAPPAATNRSGILRSILDQLRSPLTGILAAGAALSFALGSVADVAMIAGTIAVNALIGAWQEFQAGQAVAALQRIGTSTAQVLRDGEIVTVPAAHVVPGDVLVLSPGVRVAADARVIDASGLEVDEAILTGESFPVAKVASDGPAASQVVLAGSDVTVGTGRAVVFAVGNRSRIGATAAALALDETGTTPLGIRLNRMLRQVLPLAGAGGLIVFLSGWLRRRPLLPQLAIGTTIAISAIPEGLPLLAGVSEAAVARRLSARRVLVQRLSAVEALGRVDVACADKTGTLTQGRLAVRLVAGPEQEGAPARLPASLRLVLLAAGMASPHPTAADAGAHPTDVAVRDAAEAAGLGAELRRARQAESPFDPARAFHAAVVGDTLYAKGAVETLLPRCDQVRRAGRIQPLDEAGREALQERALHLAEQGLRVLMAAQGAADEPVDDPTHLIALGFIGISDPLRTGVRKAVQRCREAGIRVVMLTGDHPATARAIAREAGLLDGPGTILTGDDIAALEDGELDERLERTAVVARVTPLDKLRIVESLQRRGHTVAMTGDGVNDAPALRLADVGVAMGRGGTEVARQAAAVVLADDDFASLVEALVEGRSFWRNIRRALSLLLGGNLGELGLMVGASVLGFPAPLITRQILAVNLVTDALPSLAVSLQPPETRHLSSLAREGTAALDAPLRRAVLTRGGITAAPVLASYIAALAEGLPRARSVAFAGIVTTQLAQTLQAGRAEGSVARPVLAAVGGSAAVLLGSLVFPPLAGFLGLVAPTPLGWLLIAGSTLAAALLASRRPHLLAVPAQSALRG